MQEQDGLTPGERELERAMKSLSPSAPGIDPITAAFTAGQRSTQKHIHVWRAAAALMLVIGAASWLMPARHAAVVQPHEFSETNVAIQFPPQPPAPQSLQALQQVVNEKGLDALPAANIPTVHLLRIGDAF
jgi:hypothetical protein